jgi:hypothetical protein
VEYAIEAIKLGSTAVGIQTTEGVVLAVEKRITSPLLVRTVPIRLALTFPSSLLPLPSPRPDHSSPPMACIDTDGGRTLPDHGMVAWGWRTPTAGAGVD